MHLPLSIVTILASAALSAVTGFVSARFSQNAQRALDTHTFRVAILAELRALHSRLLRYEDAVESLVRTGQVNCAQVHHVLLQDGDTAVFANNASSIGLLDRVTALRVLRFYADIRALEGRALLLSGELSGAEAREAEQHLHRHVAALRQSRRRAFSLIRRLRKKRITGAFARLARSVRKLARRFRGRARRPAASRTSKARPNVQVREGP